MVGGGGPAPNAVNCGGVEGTNSDEPPVPPGTKPMCRWRSSANALLMNTSGALLYSCSARCRRRTCSGRTFMPMSFMISRNSPSSAAINWLMSSPPEVTDVLFHTVFLPSHPRPSITICHRPLWLVRNGSLCFPARAQPPRLNTVIIIIYFFYQFFTSVHVGGLLSVSSVGSPW